MKAIDKLLRAYKNWGEIPQRVISDLIKKGQQYGAYMDAQGNLYINEDIYLAFSTTEVTEVLNSILKEKLQGSSNSNDLLTTDEVCRLLKISRKTLQKYRDNGLIKFSQIGRKIFFEKESINQFIKNNENGRRFK